MYIFVVLCLHVTKSKQISKIIVATCSQGRYKVIEYADSEYDTKKNVTCIYLFLFFWHVTKSKQISKNIVATCSQGLYGVIEYADSEYDCHMLYVYTFCFLFTFEIDQAPVGRLLRTLRVRSRAARASEAR